MTGIIDLFNLPPQREQRRYFRARSRIQRRKDRSQKPEEMRFWGRRDFLDCLGLRFGLFISIFVYFQTLLMPFQPEARAGQSTTQCTRCYHLQTSAVCQSLAIFSFFWTLIDGADLLTTSMKIYRSPAEHRSRLCRTLSVGIEGRKEKREQNVCQKSDLGRQSNG